MGDLATTGRPVVAFSFSADSALPVCLFQCMLRSMANHDCKHCGCVLSKHRGGCEDSPKHTCPALSDFGKPLQFPRTLRHENLTRDYADYWRRVNAYWSANTEFEAARETA